MSHAKGTVTGTINYKVLDMGSYGKDITVGAAMILANILVFTPKPSKHYLNNTKRNVVEVFHKDTVLGSEKSANMLPVVSQICRFAPQLHKSAGGLPSLKLSLHSCSLPGSMNATQVSFWGGRLHFREVGEQICKFGKPQGAYLHFSL
ncbi:transposase, MuDR, MULE transposase domain protein [Tanacetum coccineum]|uniref:Transposase, MuDR, MULE transposase domain protein n=1 Tax=Tanacetum coccineum TaxID=301880 RepID=A0ABQ5HWF6_9ASTR